MMKIRVRVLAAVAGGCLSLLFASSAMAGLAFLDDFETEVIGSVPANPVVGGPYELQGSASGTPIAANPLVNAGNSSSQVLHNVRGGTSGASTGRVWFDITPAESAQVAGGELLTVRFKHYQPDGFNSIAFLAYANSDHNFTENLIDVEWRANREVLQFQPSGIQPTGLFGTNDWDDVEMVLDFTSDTWSISLNGGAPVAGIPFVDGGAADWSSASSFLIGPSTGNVSGYVDDLQVIVGQVPEPSSVAMLALCAGVISTFAGRKRTRC